MTQSKLHMRWAGTCIFHKPLQLMLEHVPDKQLHVTTFQSYNIMEMSQSAKKMFISIFPFNVEC